MEPQTPLCNGRGIPYDEKEMPATGLSGIAIKPEGSPD